jgi:hypothetical protein
MTCLIVALESIQRQLPLSTIKARRRLPGYGVVVASVSVVVLGADELSVVVGDGAVASEGLGEVVVVNDPSTAGAASVEDVVLLEDGELDVGAVEVELTNTVLVMYAPLDRAA